MRFQLYAEELSKIGWGDADREEDVPAAARTLLQGLRPPTGTYHVEALDLDGKRFVHWTAAWDQTENFARILPSEPSTSTSTEADANRMRLALRKRCTGRN